MSKTLVFKGRLGALKHFFEMDGGRKVTLDEMKALSKDEREDLCGLAVDELSDRGFDLLFTGS